MNSRSVEPVRWTKNLYCEPSPQVVSGSSTRSQAKSLPPSTSTPVTAPRRVSASAARVRVATMSATIRARAIGPSLSCGARRCRAARQRGDCSMRAFRRPLLWITLAAAAICMTIVASITLRGGARPTARTAPAIPRWAAPAVSAKRDPIDLSRLRQQLPGSGYWRDDVPTSDPAEAARRVEEERRWNALYGKVLSGTASGEEIDRYYDHLR